MSRPPDPPPAAAIIAESLGAEDDALPPGWRWAALGDVCQVNPRRSDNRHLPGDFSVTFVPMAAVDAESGSITSGETRDLSDVRKGYTAFLEGDLIFAKITPCMENGKAAIARGLINGQGFGSTEFHVLRPGGAVLAEYVWYFVRQAAFRERAAPEMTGTVGQKRLPADYMESFVLPLPPLAEQRRIVAALDAALARVTAAREHLARVPAVLKRYRAAVLAAAVEGRLTEDWRAACPPAEDGPALLRRILAERRARWEAAEQERYRKTGKTPPLDWRARYPEPSPPDTEGLPELPEGWVWGTVGQLAMHLTSGSRDWSRYYGQGTGTFILAQNVRMGRLDLTFRQQVGPPPDDRDRNRSQVQLDDLLITIVGANTGDVCRVDSQLSEHYVCQSVALARMVIPEQAEFAEMYLTAEPGGQKQFAEFMYGAARPHLSLDHLRMTTIPVVSPAEQAEIVRRVEELLAAGEAVAARAARLSAALEQLQRALLAKAFRGELVPQDPADEPAAVAGREQERSLD